MYICVSCIGKIGVGERVALKKDEFFDEIAAKREDGAILGFVATENPEGCVPRTLLSVLLNDNYMTASVVLKSGDVIILQTDSTSKLRYTAAAQGVRAGVK